MNTLIQAALDYHALGFSVVAVRQDKRAVGNWKTYQVLPMTPTQIPYRFNYRHAAGIAIICGKVSGNLEGIDMDSKYDLTGTLFYRFMEKVRYRLPGVARKLVIARTRNNGYHFFFRCSTIGRNTPLARRATTQTERQQKPGELVKVLIEMRAEAGYLIVEPTPGYHFIQGSLHSVPHITSSERTILLEIARGFDEYILPVLKPRYTLLSSHPEHGPLSSYDEDPDRRENLIALLEKHGWITLPTKGVKTYFRRPGQTAHYASGDYNQDLNLFGVFSTSTIFRPEKGYRPSAVYALLECQGNFGEAAKRLLEAGFGTPYRKKAA